LAQVNIGIFLGSGVVMILHPLPLGAKLPTPPLEAYLRTRSDRGLENDPLGSSGNRVG
jgi:hypothetical protein